MKWTPDAEAAIRKVPFFVRKRVRTRVEKEAGEAGKSVVTLTEVKATQARYLADISAEIKGYQIDTCFGAGGCPNRTNTGDALLQKIEELVRKENLLEFLKQRVPDKLKLHHEFRITFADCPNACSQPQIKDIGIIGASSPRVTDNECSFCGVCLEACSEEAIVVSREKGGPVIDAERCLKCGKCIQVCPTGTIEEGEKGYRLMLGGKLGRHPQLALEMPGIYSEDEVVAIVLNCIKFYKKHSRHGERFGAIIKPSDFDAILKAD